MSLVGELNFWTELRTVKTGPDPGFGEMYEM
jgi:hypothetical protein